MKRVILLPVLALAVLFSISSCKKSGNTGLLVPDDAAIVFHINSSSLASKLSWAEIKATNWYQELSRQSKDSFAHRIMDDPSQTGVDMKSDFVLFVKKEGKKSHLAFVGSLSDPALFENFNKKIDDSVPEIKKEGSISYIANDDQGVLSWDNSHFAYVSNIDLPNEGFGPGGNRRYEEPLKYTTDSLRILGKDVLNLGSGDKLDNDSRFVSMVKDGSDMHLWMNSEMYYEDMFGPMLSIMGNLSALTKGNVSATSFNFENGKMTMKSKQYYGKELSNFMSKHKARPVSADVVGKIPSQNLVTALAVNYPPEAIGDLLKLLQMEGVANGALAKAGLTVEDFIKANKGEMLLAVTDFTMSRRYDTIAMGQGEPLIVPVGGPNANVLFATSVNDKAAFEKLVTLAWDLLKQQAPDGAKPPVTYKMENNWFALGTSEDQVNQFLTGNSTKSAVAEKISGHPIGCYIDIRKILEVAKSDVRDSSARAALDLSMNTWQEIVGWGGEYKDKAMEFYAEVTMVDKNTNSLKQLNNYVDQIAKHFIASQKAREVELKGF